MSPLFFHIKLKLSFTENLCEPRNEMNLFRIRKYTSCQDGDEVFSLKIIEKIYFHQKCGCFGHI